MALGVRGAGGELDGVPAKAVVPSSGFAIVSTGWEFAGGSNATWSSGAPVGRPSKERAVRRPLPVTISEMRRRSASRRAHPLLHDRGEVRRALCRPRLADQEPGRAVHRTRRWCAGAATRCR